MSRSESSKRKRSMTPESTTPRKKILYTDEFDERMIEQGVFPVYHRTEIDEKLPEPANLQTIRDILRQPRPSLSPSAISETAFRLFQYNNDNATSESNLMAILEPMIAGYQKSVDYSAGDLDFCNLEKFDPDVPAPNPDTFYGARMEKIDRRVCEDLGSFIVPRTDITLPAAPNFFLQCRDPRAGRPPIVTRRQAIYCGAVGARGIHQLQNYGNTTPQYDGNAYTITSTYDFASSLRIYVTHPRQSAAGRTEYHTTQVRAFLISGDMDSFREGVTAYRNGMEWTRRERDRFIARANEVAQEMSTSTRAGGRADQTEAHWSELAVESSESEPSIDEPSPNSGRRVKRRRTSM